MAGISLTIAVLFVLKKSLLLKCFAVLLPKYFVYFKRLLYSQKEINQSKTESHLMKPRLILR